MREDRMLKDGNGPATVPGFGTSPSVSVAKIDPQICQNGVNVIVNVHTFQTHKIHVFNINYTVCAPNATG